MKYFTISFEINHTHYKIFTDVCIWIQYGVNKHAIIQYNFNINVTFHSLR